jgi:glucosamine--fructose-6-phosphate aminotransferase (isomerizing)
MCGIVGYTGYRNSKDILIEGLKRLEYRGYDSAGVAIIDSNKNIYLNKKSGRIHELEKVLDDKIDGTTGIAHTRWATHGLPNDVNAHPHTDCTKKFALVHNGIIENYASLKEDLLKKGHKFVSETDSEVLVHLIEEHYEGDLLETVFKIVELLDGAYAFVVITAHEPDKIVVARKGSPAVIGVGEGEMFVASDVPAVLKHTNQFIYMGEKEIASLTPDSVEVFDYNKNKIDKEIVTINWTIESAEKGGYPHFMLKEINEQPKVINDSSLSRLKGDKVFFKELEDIKDYLKTTDKLRIIACGTSYHSALVAQYAFRKISSMFVETYVGSEFRYIEQLPYDGLTIAISQSGETADTLESVRLSKRLGGKVLSITNVVGSTITRESDKTIYINAGPEISVASTKAYIGQLSVLYLIAMYIAQLKGKDISNYIDSFNNLSFAVNKVLVSAPDIEELAKKYSKYSNFMYIGRGFNYPSALEGALKLKEISYIHAEGYPAGELKHGPIALLDENFPVFALAPKSRIYEKVFSNIQEVKARNAKIIAIATDGDSKIKNIVDDVIYIPETLEEFSPLPIAVAMQLFAYYVAVENKRDVDKPRNLAKSVTVE